MCKNVSNIILNTRKSDKPWNPLFYYLTQKCNCSQCQIKYKKIEGILKIRNIFRRKLNTVNNNFRNLKSITDKESDYHLQKWMLPLYHKINDLDIVCKYTL